MVVVGAGVAGLSAALAAADAGASVLVLAKASHTSSNSYAAQGGVAAAVGPGDDPALHAADTLAAGRGLCRPSAVRLLTEEAPERIAELRRLGVRFDDGLAREGGHSRARVVHAGGADTGRYIADVLTARAREHPRIRLVEGERITTLGALRGSAVVLATGGYAALWARTTNPRGAVGDGLLLAQAAGAALADLEFVQFHPTALRDENGHDGFLLSEALRGAGATLLDDGGERFVDELAPRDVVARAVAARAGARLDLRPVERDRYPDLDGDARATRATTRPTSRSRSPPPPTTPSAASSATSTGARRCPGCTRPASAHAPACTAQTGSPRTRCSSASSSAAAPASPRSTGRASTPTPSPIAPGADRGRRALARRRADPRRRGPRAAARLAAPARPRDRRLRPRARGEPRRPLPRGLPRRERGARRAPRRRVPAASPSWSHGADAGGHRPRRRRCARRGRRLRRRDDARARARGRALPRRASARGAGRRLRRPGRGRRLPRARPAVQVEAKLEEGTAVSDVPAVVAVVEGPARAILSGERVALNLLGTALRHRVPDAPLRRADRGHAHVDPRHPQDDARPARAREVRRSLRRRHATTAPASTTAMLVKENHLRVAGGVSAALAALDGRVRRAAGRGRGRDARAGARGARRRRADGSCSTT